MNHSNNLKRSFDSESQVFAYRLTHAQSTLSFSADKIFTKCTFFPEEFSFFITFKYEPDNLSSTGSSRNSQCIFSLRHPTKKVTLIALEINNNHFVLTYNNTRKKFFDVRLSESKWHSVSLSLSEDGAYLVLDCSEEQKRKVRRTFPAMLDTRGSEFQLGKCSRKSFPFQGLIKELLFLPGTDATSLACTKNVGRTEGKNTLVLPERHFHFVEGGSQYQSEITSEKSCTWKDMGNIAYDLKKNLLKVCLNGIWRDTPDRHRCQLDYFEWYQDLMVEGGAVDVEVFSIPGEGLFAAFASNAPIDDKAQTTNRSKTRSTSSRTSAMYKWINGKFMLYQTLPSDAAHSFKSFKIGQQFFLAVANYGAAMDGSSTISTIFRWNMERQKFRVFQQLQTWTATDIEFFDIKGTKFIAVVNYAKGNSLFATSIIYRWNRKIRRFQKVQQLKTTGARDMTAFQVLDYQFLIVSQAFNGRTTLLDSDVYIWHDGKFVKFSSMETMGAVDWEYFSINNEHYLAVVNSYNFGPQNYQKTNTYSTQSSIYKLNIRKKVFERLQDVPTYSAIDWEFFTIGEQKYLVVSNAQNTEDSREHDSVIYRWQGVDQFVPVHRMKLLPTADFEAFKIGQDIYLLYANPKSNVSQILKAKFI